MSKMWAGKNVSYVFKVRMPPSKICPQGKSPCRLGSMQGVDSGQDEPADVMGPQPHVD